MDTIRYQGVEVVPPPFGSRDFWHWRCGRCKRQGRDQTRELAETGKRRHEAMHAAQDRAAATVRAVAGLPDDDYAALCRLYDVLEMTLFRGLAPEGERRVGCPTETEMIAALERAGRLLWPDPRWLTTHVFVLRDGMLVAVPGSEVQA